jgi:mono/diheme cytochrome c family protein
MKNICIVLVLVMLVAAPLSLWSADEDGAALFKSNCSRCHGENGEGKTMGTMKMPAVKGTKMSADKLVEYLTKGEAGKKVHGNPVSGLTEEQAKAVAGYVKAMK